MRETETSAPSLGNWVMVPREATEAMQHAGQKVRSQHVSNRGPYAQPDKIWDAMLAAAPPTAMAEAVASARAEAIEEFGAPTEDELDERIARQGARENMRLIDSISDLIGQPHDVELTKSDVANALASARAEGVKEGLERAADEVEGIASEWRGDGRAYAMTVAAILRTGDALSSAMSALTAPPTLIPGGSSDV